jgi:hypothetical protein
MNGEDPEAAVEAHRAKQGGTIREQVEAYIEELRQGGPTIREQVEVYIEERQELIVRGASDFDALTSGLHNEAIEEFIEERRKQVLVMIEQMKTQWCPGTGGSITIVSKVSRAGHRRCGTDSGNASAIIANTVAIALVLPIRRDERVIALPFCATLAREVLTNSWREAGRYNAGEMPEFPDAYQSAWQAAGALLIFIYLIRTQAEFLSRSAELKQKAPFAAFHFCALPWIVKIERKAPSSIALTKSAVRPNSPCLRVKKSSSKIGRR